MFAACICYPRGAVGLYTSRAFGICSQKWGIIHEGGLYARGYTRGSNRVLKDKSVTKKCLTFQGLRGATFIVTFVVSFHTTFITKVDRAYRLICGYGGGDADLTAGISVR